MSAFRNAVLSITATLASFGVLYAFCALAGVGPSPAVLSAALTVGLMRRPEQMEWRELLIKFLTLPLIAFAASLVGAALLHFPVLGAVLFTGGVTVSIALRRYGERAAAIGRAVALPFMAILVVPVTLEGGSRHGAVAVLVLAAGAVALLSATCASHLGARLGLIPRPTASRRRVQTARRGTVPVSLRMALQMCVALSLAFTIGLLALPAHWPWIVLSAFIVCSGTVSRGDAAYKALLRLGGAIGGTIVATAVSLVAIPSFVAPAALIFGVLFVGIWLRQINYAYWAACATLLFGLLQGTGGKSSIALFGARVLCIFVGVLCGVAAAWFIYPTRTRQLVRRRIADALGAMHEALGGETPDLARHVADLRAVAPPVRLHRAIFGAKNSDEHPATWIDRAHELIPKLQAPGFDRDQIGAEMRNLGALIRGTRSDVTAQPPSKPPP